MWARISWSRVCFVDGIFSACHDDVDRLGSFVEQGYRGGHGLGKGDMNLGRVGKKFFNLVLALLFAWTNVVNATGENQPTIILSAEPVTSEQGQTGLGVKIEVYEGDNAEAAVEEALKENPNGTVTVFTADSAGVANKEANGNLQVISVDPTQLKKEAEDLKAHDPALKKLIEKSQSRNLLEKIKDKKSGIFITILGASGFGLCHFLLKHNLDMATKMFLVGLVVNGFQVLANSTWRSYLRKGGEVVQSVTNKFSQFLGRAVSDRNIATDFGKVGAALLFNLGVSISVLQLQGALDNALWVLALATAGCWDAIWDLVIDRHIQEGNLREEHFSKFVRFRVIFGPWVEMAAYSGATIGALAAALMALVGGTGIVSYMSAKHISEYLKRTKADPKKRNWFSFKKSQKIPEPFERVECGKILEMRSEEESPAKSLDDAS